MIQKSVREGFGLVVSEALWKRTPVVAGRAGGIPLQLQGGAGGFLVDSIDECADRAQWLLEHPREGHELAQAGRELVRSRFLLTRLIADELRLYAALLGTRTEAHIAAQVGLSGEPRDPICGMHIDPDKARWFEYLGRRYSFCSEACRTQFAAAPERFSSTANRVTISHA